MVILVLAALGLLSALGLADAMLATRVAALAEERVRAHAAMLEALPALFTPPDVPWLCLRSPDAPIRVLHAASGGSRVELVWWAVGRGAVRAQITGLSPLGGRHRRLALMAPDSLPTDPGQPGCPGATRLVPAGEGWLLPHPEG
jgi:hypothetical protein